MKDQLTLGVMMDCIANVIESDEKFYYMSLDDAMDALMDKDSELYTCIYDRVMSTLNALYTRDDDVENDVIHIVVTHKFE